MVAASIVCASAFGTGVSSATEPLPVAVRISESSHAACPKKPGLRERLEAHLGHIRAPAEGEAAIDVAISIKRQESLSVGTLTLSAAGVSVQREASSPSCEDVIAALTVMAAISIGEQAERLSHEPAEQVNAPPSGERPSGEPPSPAARSDTRPPPPPPSPLPSVGTPSDRAGPSKRVAVSFGSGVEVNGNRGAVLLGTWFAEVRFPVPFDPTVRLGLARSTREVASIPRGAIAIRWVELTWATCADLYRDQRFRVGPCLNGELGRLEASVVRPLPARDIPSDWISVGGSARMSWRLLPPLSIEMMVGARAPLLRRELFFEPFRQPLAYQAPSVAPFAEIGFVAHLP